jgi:serine/threonine protein kinase
VKTPPAAPKARNVKAWAIGPGDYGLDSRLDAIVRRTLSQDPRSRYQSASEFAAALKTVGEPALQAQNEPSASLPDLLSDAHAITASEFMPGTQVGHAVNSTSQGSTPRPIVSPNAPRLQLHRDFLANWTPQLSPRSPTSTPISEDERWEVVDRWSAFPELPTADEVQEKLELRRKFKRIGAWLSFGLTCFIVLVLKVNIAEMSWIHAP